MDVRGSDVQHDEAKHEGVKKFSETCLPQAVALCWCQVEGIAEHAEVAEACDNACDNLDDAVDADFHPFHLLGKAQCHGHGWIEVSTGGFAERVDHDSEDAGDRN